MFSFFRRKPKCPILPGDKSWVENRLNWLCGQFGDARFLERPVWTPTPEHFPGVRGTSVRGESPDDIQPLFERVCELMDIPIETVRLDVFVDQKKRLDPTTAELFGVEHHTNGLFYDGIVPTVSIERDVLRDPMKAVATLAHELAHVRLLNEGRISPKASDNEALTDLTAIFFGFGVFTVNGCAHVSHWSKDKGYLSKPIAAYALAHWAWARGDAKPDWIRYLDIDGAHWSKASLRFLLATGDTDFSPLGFDPGK
jgi:hypothetical protein